ncbi:exonuclease domain-containing protein [Mycolicibacterium frederiksbergense]|nr:exonuclease domain-containing protein [Mycolicibacterium frederiksbergense]
MDFVAIDFEIANPNYASVCAMGWATVRNGAIADQGSWLCRPPAGLDEFGPYNVRVHGITAERVSNQPTFAERVPDLFARLDTGLPIVAHNAAFDIGVLEQSLATCGRTRPPTAHYCTKKWSKRLFDLPKYTLPQVCAHLGVVIGRHHEAGDDAVAAAQVAIRLAETVGVSTIGELDAAARRR